MSAKTSSSANKATSGQTVSSAAGMVKSMSNRILGMKFMQRAEEAQIRKNLEEEKQRLEAEAEWAINPEILKKKIPTPRFSVQDSYWAMLDSSTDVPIIARYSFNGFNEPIEAIRKAEAQIVVNKSRVQSSDAEEKKRKRGKSVPKEEPSATQPASKVQKTDANTSLEAITANRFRFLKPQE